MDDLIIINKLQRLLKTNYETIGENIMSGGVDNMEKYKYLLGQAHATQIILQEISNLLNKKEQNDESGTVVEFGNTENKTRT
jgi:hypothetical protein